MTGKSFVYALTRPDGTLFYIGKGTGKRISDHEREARCGLTTIKCQIIRKIWADGGVVGRAVLKSGLSSEDAYKLEVELIAKYGRIDIGTGILANHTDGGDGVRGHSDQTRAILSARTKAQMTPEARARLRELGLEQFADVAARERMSASCRAAQLRPETRQANSIRGKQQASDPAFKRRMSEASSAWNGTPEGRAVQSALKRAQWLDPAYRQKVLAAQAAGRARKKQLLIDNAERLS